MTTIAYKDGVMAGDRQLQSGDTRVGETTKVFKLSTYHSTLSLKISGRVYPVSSWKKPLRDKDWKHQVLLGVSGSCSAITAMILAYNAGALVNDDGVLQVPDVPTKDWCLLAVFQSADAAAPWTYRPDDGWSRVEVDTYTAIGSGSVFAVAAMDFGADAESALKYAATRDLQTGCGVDVVRFGDN